MKKLFLAILLINCGMSIICQDQAKQPIVKFTVGILATIGLIIYTTAYVRSTWYSPNSKITELLTADDSLLKKRYTQKIKIECDENEPGVIFVSNCARFFPADTSSTSFDLESMIIKDREKLSDARADLLMPSFVNRESNELYKTVDSYYNNSDTLMWVLDHSNIISGSRIKPLEEYEKNLKFKKIKNR